MVNRFDVWLTGLNPAVGSEINKSRPCLVISPNEANKYLGAVTVVPLTSTLRTYPTRVNCVFEGRQGQLAIDQIRSVDKTRLIKKLGVMDKETNRLLCNVMVETFRY